MFIFVRCSYKCGKCDGRGTDPLTGKTCDMCNGTGELFG
jgi:DnaJ-class molecular chaperone